MKDRDHLNTFLFHLAKGLIKPIPVVGPIIEEVFLEQFKEYLCVEVDRLSDEDVARVVGSLPKVDIEAVTAKMDDLSEENRLFAVQQMTSLLEFLQSDFSRIDGKLDEIDTKVAPVSNIAEMVSEMSEKLGSEEALRMALDEIAAKREAWRSRISNNQRRLLALIPTDYVPVRSLRETTLEISPNGTEKEFRFRLHELEWLGLVRRCYDRQEGDWRYRRVGSGELPSA